MFCLMGNHYLLRYEHRETTHRVQGDLSLECTGSNFYLKSTDNLLFMGRYKAIKIEASSYLLEVSRYNYRNTREMQKRY